jgi:hypothetical protein
MVFAINSLPILSLLKYIADNVIEISYAYHKAYVGISCMEHGVSLEAPFKAAEN